MKNRKTAMEPADSQVTAGETGAPKESSASQNETRSEKTDDNDLKQVQENQALETGSISEEQSNASESIYCIHLPGKWSLYTQLYLGGK
ncbi:hypothetical protein ABFV83_17140 [Lacrimispora sp. BS-2]|uniref:Uncharacterized protein n=1 Tax=Lacrimispora sp. BS-2 TaxID=3151850 RepID=A0AAU7PN52_9FIRM